MAIMAPDEPLIAERPAAAESAFDIVLKPLAHAGLGDIRIEENLFAIGRTEPPFAGYARHVVAQLSRRHARIFAEQGVVYIADLDSKNGTTVNSVKVREKPVRLNNGDDIGFGGSLSYRVALVPRANMPQRALKLASLTLTPERGDLGLLPIVITRFPFLVSKAEESFSRYVAAYPHQVNYLSRRHAHIFLKGAQPFIEDLGSTNGTFVASRRLDEHAAAVEEGSLVAFGGNHFVYRASLQKEAELESTLTKLAPPEAAGPACDMDKTTFVASADSFLDIFCVDAAQPLDDEINDEALAREGAMSMAPERFPILGRLVKSLGGRDKVRRVAIRALCGVLVLALLGLALRLRGAPERDMRNRLASRDYDGAAAAGERYLERSPDNNDLKALDTEALLKAGVPRWLDLLRARDFSRAATTLSGMKGLARHNADLLPMVSELEWIGQLEQFVIGRGGVEAPIRIYADEARIKALLKAWDEDANGHQMVFAAISAQVPDFKEPYAAALSHLRKLQSDDAVYLPAIKRLNTAINADLDQGRPEALEAVFQEYGDKYPRIGGLDDLRRDLRQYLEIAAEKPGVPTASTPRFATPPFQARVQALLAHPPASVSPAPAAGTPPVSAGTEGSLAK